VFGLPAPDFDLEEAGVAVAPLAVLLDPLRSPDNTALNLVSTTGAYPMLKSQPPVDRFHR
jgi:hypothetical protein